MRIGPFDANAAPPPRAVVTAGRALSGGSHGAAALNDARQTHTGYAERIGPAPYGTARKLELYLENTRPYSPPRQSSWHVFV